MSGSKMGAVKRKLGLKGKTKPGEMMTRMNKIKNKGLIDMVKSVGSEISGAAGMVRRNAVPVIKAFGRNLMGGDVKMITKKKKKNAKKRK